MAEEKEKTMIEIYTNDRREVNLIKIKTQAKNVPDVLHRAIKLLKEHIKKEGVK